MRNSDTVHTVQSTLLCTLWYLSIVKIIIMRTYAPDIGIYLYKTYYYYKEIILLSLVYR